MSLRLQSSSASYGGGFGGGSCQLGGGRGVSTCSTRSPCRTSTTAWLPTWRRCAP
ncbi:KRT13 isoform 6 [Pongo abelii]|nr:KRT13 isoform 6 [Pongo abelii]